MMKFLYGVKLLAAAIGLTTTLGAGVAFAQNTFAYYPHQSLVHFTVSKNFPVHWGNIFGFSSVIAIHHGQSTSKSSVVSARQSSVSARIASWKNSVRVAF